MLLMYLLASFQQFHELLNTSGARLRLYGIMDSEQDCISVHTI